MRHTPEYNFNLLDGEDRLSPKPLNENMELVEAEILAARADALADLNAAVGLGGRTARIQFGSYVGQSYGGTITCDFTPVFVQISGGEPSDGSYEVAEPFVRGAKKAGQNVVQQHSGAYALTWSGNSVTFTGSGGANIPGVTHYWVALGYDPVTEPTKRNG